MAANPLPAIVNRIPPGLLAALGIKNSGRNPTGMSEWVQPVMEMRDWYLETQQDRLRSTAVIFNASGNQATDLVVPAGEWWLVWDSCVNFTSTTGTGIFSPYWSVPGVSGSIVRYGTSIAVAAGDTRLATLNPRPFFLPPTSSMQATCTGYAGAGQVSLTGFCAVTRLAI